MTAMIELERLVRDSDIRPGSGLHRGGRRRRPRWLAGLVAAAGDRRRHRPAAPVKTSMSVDI